ncbi:Protein artemis [Cladobotryum mycophilum]|uniref:Protein artemis n=1 Tax=Cladobotryum mycophilum TaxID=491253 RepID=A0ABR0SWF1_9HYPO
MSTFNGLVLEFPDIRIDFFRSHVDSPPPLACFLSHVHSDHLAGLETLRSPFVYCSAATREILLRLERYPYRINYAKGLLEARQQTYKHLSKVMKPLPLETPTILELQPGQHIQVTMFDANHCPGAVMFLIEGDGKAIIYTGDVRCEPWFVNSLSRNPNLIEYTYGIKSLDKLYLDTSFIEDVPFQTKAEGIAELLRKVSQYPKDTVFYIQAWTYGYEDVWIALSKTLNSKIHVDDYKFRIYNSLRVRFSDNKFSSDVHLTPAAAALTGYLCGNSSQPGCLTCDENVRLHSCESGNMCRIAQQKSVVRIQPVIARLPSGESILEAGVGGGGEDLEREVELGALSLDDLNEVLEIICSLPGSTEEMRSEFMKLFTLATASGRNLPLNLGISDLEDDLSANLLQTLLSIPNKTASRAEGVATSKESTQATLPNIIRFPYSRHSSYPELCQLVNAFKPKDIWPCTVDPKHWLKSSITIRSLFGEYCSSDRFSHDLKMKEIFKQKAGLQVQGESQTTETQVSRITSSPVVENTFGDEHHSGSQGLITGEASTREQPAKSLETPKSSHYKQDHTMMPNTSAGPSRSINLSPRKRDFIEFADNNEEEDECESQRTDCSFTSVLSMRHSRERQEAYQRMLQNARGETWGPIELISTGSNYNTREQEL